MASPGASGSGLPAAPLSRQQPPRRDGTEAAPASPDHEPDRTIIDLTVDSSGGLYITTTTQPSDAVDEPAGTADDGQE
jgi:hypothetical protein